MDNPFKRWFARSRNGAGWPAASEWASRTGHRFARSRDGSGFVIEPAAAPNRASFGRLEWGAAQRHYIEGPELRLRADVGCGGNLQMLVLTRALMVALEQAVFEEYTESNQTRMDDKTPEEMRWLVLYPKLPRSVLGPLAERFGALSSLPRAAAVWLEGPLAARLAEVTSWLPEASPLVITVQRERLSLRCALAEPEVAALQGATALFEAALAAARRVSGEVAEGHVGSERPSTWGAPSVMPGAGRAPR